MRAGRGLADSGIQVKISKKELPYEKLIKIKTEEKELSAKIPPDGSFAEGSFHFPDYFSEIISC